MVSLSLNGNRRLISAQSRDDSELNLAFLMGQDL